VIYHTAAIPLTSGVLLHEVEVWRRRVAVQPPSDDLRRLPEPTRLAWLAAYAHLRGCSRARPHYRKTRVSGELSGHSEVVH
jgi:hypothetical protein